MKSINIISSLREGSKLEDAYNFNRVVAWFLRKALEKKGVEVRFVEESDLLAGSLPKSDHTLVISAKAMNYVRGTHKDVHGKTPTIRSKLRKATKGKMALYLDADYSQWSKIFDYIFTVVKPRTKDPEYVYAGWGADPEYCYPDQEEQAIFLDSFNLKRPRRRERMYKIYDEVLPALNIKVHPPRLVLGGRRKGRRVSWLEHQEILRKCHYFCCTGLGESGLTRIESATCGALLVVPRMSYVPRTMASLEHRIWNTKQDLIKILTTKTDPEAIRKKALKHSWDKVATRIVKRLN